MRVLMPLLAIALTVGAYLAARALHLKLRHPLVNIVLVGAVLVAGALTLLGIPYEAYAPGRALLLQLLGPATVGLAVPLHRHRALVRRHAGAVAAGVGLGALVAVGSAAWLGTLLGLPRELVLSLLPRSVTIPFALEVVKLHGGSQALASAFVVATGTLGSVAGASLLTWAGVKDPVARGLALGAAAHGQGTAMAFLEGPEQGTLAGLALTLSGITTTVLAPLAVRLLVPA